MPTDRERARERAALGHPAAVKKPRLDSDDTLVDVSTVNHAQTAAVLKTRRHLHITRVRAATLSLVIKQKIVRNTRA